MTRLGWRRCLAAGVVLVGLSSGPLGMPRGHVAAAAHVRPSHAPASEVIAPRSCLTALRADRHGHRSLNLPVSCLSAILGTRTARVAQTPNVLPTGVITTYAGGARGGGKPTTYGLEPWGVAFDGAGHLLISDQIRSNNLVWLANLTTRAISTFGQTIAAGRMVSVAGNDISGEGCGSPSEGCFGGDGGPATQARLNVPSGVAVDGAGNLFIADDGNFRIREVLASSGIITTVAGSGKYPGFKGDGGPATQAKLGAPVDVAVDRGGNLLIADSRNGRIREVLAATGIITTVVGGASGCPRESDPIGDGCPAIQAALSSPDHVMVDGAGNLFIADSGNNRIREVLAATGIITTVAGTGVRGFGGDGGPATQAELNNPYGVAVDGAGNLFIADYGNFRIREMLAATGIITTVAGNGCSSASGGCFGGDGGPATGAELNYPTGVVADGAGNLFIADNFNDRIREVLAATGMITTVVGNGTHGFGGDGGPATGAELNQTQGVVVDGAGNLFIVDTAYNCIREVLASTGVIITIAGNGKLGFSGDGGPAARAELSLPGGMAMDGAGNLFIADTYNARIREVLASTGLITTVAGNGSPQCTYPQFICFGGDGGPATSAELNRPNGVAVDGAGNLFIADEGNDRIREVLAATGVITTVVGNGTNGFSGDGGPATQAELNGPNGVAVDGGGNLFIADTNNERIREVLAGMGVITTVAGNGSPGCPTEGPCFSGDGGPATQAALYAPFGVAVDRAGNVFIADTNNERIREVLTETSLITTVAGNGCGSPTEGCFSGDGGPAASAALNYPYGVAVDGAGDLFIADTYNNRVRQVHLTSSAAPSLAVSPSSGVYQQSITLTGTNFAPSETVNIYANNTSHAPLYSPSTDATGAFVLPTTADQGPYGPHTLIAVGQTSGLSATTMFTVLPELLLAPASGAAGATVVAAGYGFGTSEPVALHWGAPTSLTLGATNSNGYGTFAGSSAITFTVPLSATTGTYQVYAVGQNSGVQAGATFTVP